MNLQSMRRINFSLMALLLLLSSQATFSQSLEQELLGQSVRQFKVEAKNIHLALSKIAYEYKAPIGLEVAKRGDEGPKININIQDGTLRDVLNTVIEQDPKYEWSVTNGVINVFPKTHRDELLEDLLGTRVEHFIVSEGTSIWNIRHSITELPEVKLKMEISRVTPNLETWGDAGFQKASPGFTLNLSDTTVREILNQIISKTDAKYWIVNRYGESKQFIIINF